MTSVIHIYTDGSCSANGSAFAVGGWAAILEGGPKQLRISGHVQPATSNRMELQAAIEGLAAVLNLAAEVHLYTDSQYVQRGCSEWLASWKQNGWRTAAKKLVKNSDLWQMLDVHLQRLNVKVHWVEGHCGHPMNELGDTLAGMARRGQAVKQRRKAGDVTVEVN